ncbi:hypothetical protein Vafri_15970, partial [Volvox africanus]
MRGLHACLLHPFSKQVIWMNAAKSSGVQRVLGTTLTTCGMRRLAHGITDLWVAFTVHLKQWTAHAFGRRLKIAEAVTNHSRISDISVNCPSMAFIHGISMAGDADNTAASCTMIANAAAAIRIDVDNTNATSAAVATTAITCRSSLVAVSAAVTRVSPSHIYCSLHLPLSSVLGLSLASPPPAAVAPGVPGPIAREDDMGSFTRIARCRPTASCTRRNNNMRNQAIKPLLASLPPSLPPPFP